MFKIAGRCKKGFCQLFDSLLTLLFRQLYPQSFLFSSQVHHSYNWMVSGSVQHVQFSWLLFEQDPFQLRHPGKEMSNVKCQCQIKDQCQWKIKYRCQIKCHCQMSNEMSCHVMSCHVMSCQCQIKDQCQWKIKYQSQIKCHCQMSN